MAKELKGNAKIEVKAINWTIGQARTLEYEETCLIENRQLINGDEVVWTDDDVGEIFRGWVNAEKGKRASGDEGGDGNAADLGRCIAKQRAYLMCPDACPPFSAPPALPGSSKFRIRKGTKVSDAINIVLKFLGATGLHVIGTISIAPAVGNLTLTTDIDKGGMPMADWINEILSQTPGGIWYTKGSDFYVVDFYAQGAAPLEEADFLKPMPDPRTNVVVQSREIGESTDAKYRGVVVEGAGAFRRMRLYSFNDTGGGTSCSPRKGELVRQMGDSGVNTGIQGPTNIWAFNYRWYLPENVCLDNYFDANGVGVNGVFLTYKATYTESGGPVTRWSKDNQFGTAILTVDEDPFAFDVGPAGNLKGDYNGNISYVVNDVVKYQGLWYKAILGGIANPPTNVTYWTLYPDSGLNPRKGKFYVATGWTIGNVGAPAPPVFDFAEFEVRYTIFEGPFMVTKFSADPRLLREGDFPYQREDLFKYHQDETRSKFSAIIPGHEGDLPTPPTYFPILERLLDNDPTPDLQAIADALYPQKVGVHQTGSLPVHLSPKFKDIALGQYIAKFGTDCRIRAVKIDPNTRTAVLEVSGIPIRDAVQGLNLLARQKAEKAKNWGDRHVIKCADVHGLPSIVLKDNCRPLQEATVDRNKNGLCAAPAGSG